MRWVKDEKIEMVMEAFHRHREWCQLMEGSLPFVIYRRDTNAILARGIVGYENAAQEANRQRKRLGLRWDQVHFKADRSIQKQSPPPPASGGGRRYDYSPRYNPSKRKRFSGVWDKHGNYIELD